MAKPTIALCICAVMLAIAETDGQRWVAFVLALFSLILLGLRKTEDSVTTVAQLDARRWLIGALWLSLLPLCWWLAQYAGAQP